MRPLGRAWPRLRRRLTSAKPAVLFLDFDGTLARIAKTPDQATLPQDTRLALIRLNCLPATYIGIISGRSLKEIKRMVGIPNLIYAGNHGLEVAGPNFAFVHPRAQAARPLLRRLARRLAEAIQWVPGASVEWKGLTVSLHWRRVPKSAQRKFHQLVDELVGPYRCARRLRLTYGKRVIEIRPPVNWDKGAVVEWIFNRLAARHRPARPWLAYLGDDQTDEDAFRVVNCLRGISIRVGALTRPTAATGRLRDPRDVRRWLVELSRLRSAGVLLEGGRACTGHKRFSIR